MPEWLDLRLVVSCASAFLLGSIPFGLLVARIAGGADVRRSGSGNIGATNVARVLGFWPWGFATFVLDFAKGVLPVLALSAGWIGALLGDHAAAAGAAGGDLLIGTWATALFAVLGHCYTPWLKLKGGKGVATGLGALLVLSPWASLIGIVAFALAFAATRTGSLSSLSGILGVSVSHLILAPTGPHLWLGGLLVLVIVVRHESNLDALLHESEKTFG